ncbi:PREDICTED: protein GAST1-like [Ipomoea nil]|uniref:protein GAST1-like n=1 Tax=Ipomoea nil TaxID=35883 RepID=UPI00090146DC|nr:PREDICTED: protein GAST1-like [Ipomoea nil]
METMKHYCLALVFLVIMIFAPLFDCHNIISESPAPQPSPGFHMYGSTPGSLHPQECLPKCTYRCSNTQYRKPCMFFCQKCCAKCLCVPPGTYGNKQFCPCYNNWKTKRGGPKCP